MKLTDTNDIRGRLTIQQYDRNDRLIHTVTANNSILKTGRTIIANLFIGGSGFNPISHVGVGRGTKPVKVTDEGLEIAYGDLISIEPIKSTGMVWHTSEGIERLSVTIAANLQTNQCNDIDITEAGLFNQDNIMYNRVVFPPIHKTVDFKLTLIWEIMF